MRTVGIGPYNYLAQDKQTPSALFPCGGGSSLFRELLLYDLHDPGDRGA